MKKLLFTAAVLGLTAASFAQVPNYVPTNGLVGWWPFNSNANDESGNGNNGTVNGATLTTDRFGYANQAYSFDGVDDFINLPSGTGTTLNVVGNYSLSIWLKTSQITYGSQITFADNQISGGGFLFNHMVPNNTNNLSFYTGDSWNLTNCNLNDNTWINFIVVCAGNSMNIFRNGILCYSSNTIVACTSWNGSRMFGVASQGNIGFYNGLLDDIGIWNRALTDCEVQDLYNSQLESSNSTSTQTQTALDSYTWPVNGQTYTQSGTYIDTLSNAAGCDSIVTLNLTLSYTGINELSPANDKQLVKITDLNGKEVPFRKNVVLLFIYDDGTVERVYITE